MDSNVYRVPEAFAARARVTRADYDRIYQESVRDPDKFWGRIGRRIDWIREFTKVKDTNFDAKSFNVRWFQDGTLNVSANCLDRHLDGQGDKTAIIWEGDDPKASERISYRQLYERVCQ